MSNNNECSICLENIEKENMYITECCHKFCNECFQNWSKICKDQKNDVKCPTCRTLLEEISVDNHKSLILLIENTLNYDLNFLNIEEDEEDESSFDVEDRFQNLTFFNVQVVEDEREEDEDTIDELYHIQRTRELEMEVYGERYTY